MHVAFLIKIFLGAIIMGVYILFRLLFGAKFRQVDMGRIGFASCLVSATFCILHFAPPSAADSAPARANPEPLQFSNKVVGHEAVPASSVAGTATV